MEFKLFKDFVKNVTKIWAHVKLVDNVKLIDMDVFIFYDTNHPFLELQKRLFVVIQKSEQMFIS